MTATSTATATITTQVGSTYPPLCDSNSSILTASRLLSQPLLGLSCATDSAGKLLGLGKAGGSYSSLATYNHIIYPADGGDSQEACCNRCFFSEVNCIQAFYFSYEGCVIMQTDSPLGTGKGVSAVCPNGLIAGLTYSVDVNPDFRSTGDIAGPCGIDYGYIPFA